MNFEVYSIVAERARGLAWIGRWPSKPAVAGSNPAASVQFEMII